MSDTSRETDAPAGDTGLFITLEGGEGAGGFDRLRRDYRERRELAGSWLGGETESERNWSPRLAWDLFMVLVATVNLLLILISMLKK